MAEHDPTERALLLLSLLQTHRFWPGAELTERLGVSARTLRRDVDRLRVARATRSTRRPGRRRWLPPRRGRAPPATPARRRRSRRHRGRACAPRPARRSTAWRTPRSRALAKLEQVLPGPAASARARGALERRVAAVGRRGRPSTPTRSRCSRSRVVTTSRCASTTAGATATRPSRLVEPHQLVSTGRRWYLVAWDVRRDDWRTFRLDRLERRTPRGRALRAARAPRRRRGRVRGRVDPHDADAVLGAARGRRARRRGARRAPLERRRGRGARRPSAARVRVGSGEHDALVRVVTWLAGSFPVVVREPDDAGRALVDSAGAARSAALTTGQCERVLPSASTACGQAVLVVLGDHDRRRVGPARRALRVAPHLEGPERLLERVVGQEPADQRVAEVEDAA